MLERGVQSPPPPAPEHEPGPRTARIDVPLPGGDRALVRPLTRRDGRALVGLLSRMSQTSAHRRFGVRNPRLDGPALERLLDVDGRDRIALVAELGGRILGVARCARQGDREAAEVALAVEDRFQRAGLGTALLLALASTALAQGIRRLTAMVMPENRPALALLCHAGFTASHRVDGGVVRFTLHIDSPRRP